MSAGNFDGNFGFRPEHIVDIFLRGFAGTGTPSLAEVHLQVNSLLVGPFEHLKPKLNEIVNEILRRVDVRIGNASVLEDSTNHQTWLDAFARDQWRLWPRLHGYLRDNEKLPVAVIAELDRSTDLTLDLLEAPNRIGAWDRRGLVLGHVQSGKTTHYTALAAKAIDAGYRIVIILAGMHNSLRSQTHDRIDRLLIGRDSCALNEPGLNGSRLLGVGEYARALGLDEVPFSILTCTSSAENGDFKDRLAKQVWIEVNEGARLVMVVKKNATILRKLRDWLRMLLAEQSAPGTQQLILQPTLFIDDEADQASINTRDADQDPTAINGLIRELLVSFARVGLVGYTATPFANIFIDPSAKPGQPKFGADLFPKSFIVSLKSPNNYVGPSTVFGHPGDESVGLVAEDPLPMYIPVSDSQAWVPSPHRKDVTPGPLPESLQEAIRVFILTCSARAVRGDDKVHNSMLIHATRFVAAQSKIALQVESELRTLQTLLSHGSAETRKSLCDSLQCIWQRRFVGCHFLFKDRLGKDCLPLPSWEEVWTKIAPSAGRIRVMKINGTSDDALAYTRASDGLSVIAIGGDKLSRGVTLEGLSVSYFLRTSNMFDTLMQMGRWFGYRPRYADLCRVYTTAELYGSFREIALAIDDLRSELDRMALANRTPEDFGLRVRTPSDGLLITAANKLRKGETVKVRFAGELVQALQIPSAGNPAQVNREALHRLVESLPVAERSIRGRESGHFIWHNVPCANVVEFLTSYDAYRTHSFLNRCEQLRRYVQDRNLHKELVNWTVCLISKRPEAGVSMCNIGDLDVPLITRGIDKVKESVVPPGHHIMRVVTGREEEAADLSNEEYQIALEATHELERRAGKSAEELSKQPDRKDIRSTRPVHRGLLMLYPIEHPSKDSNEFLVSAAVSFPDSDAAPLIYTVNDIWRAEYGHLDDWDEDGQPV